MQSADDNYDDDDNDDNNNNNNDNNNNNSNNRTLYKLHLVGYIKYTSYLNLYKNKLVNDDV